MKRHARKMIESLMGPTGSIVVHIILVMILVKFVFFATNARETDVEVIIMEPESVDLEDIKKELRELEDVEVDAITPPDVSIETEAPPEDVEDFDNADPDVDFAALEVIDAVQSPLVMRGLYAGRSASGRRGALNRHAGKWAEHTERAVIRALEWLRENQKEDGSWDEGNKHAMTGLGLLTFLAHGETPTSERYGPTVEKAIRWLVNNQDEQGRLSGNVYEHGIATYAVSEAYGLTQIPSLREAMNKGVSVIIDGQQPGGGWDYGYAQTPRRDTSVTGWQVQALKAAKIANADDMSRIDTALRKSVADLKKVQKDSTGRFGYSNDPGSGSIGMTGVGVLCMQLLGFADDPACRKGIDYLNAQDLPVEWVKEGGGHDLYGWYYITQAKFHHGKKWKEWNNAFAKAFTRSQNEDGSWLAPGEEASRGKVYGTTFAALTLQVYYRLLPTYQQKAVEEVNYSVEEEDEEDLVEVI